MAIITEKIFQCDRCSHKWYSQKYDVKTNNLPVACSSCKSPYWNRGAKK